MDGLATTKSRRKAHPHDCRGRRSRQGKGVIFFLLRFVLRTEDKSRKIGAALEIVDDYPFDLRSQRSQDIREQIMGERSLLLRALLEHRDCQTSALLNVNHENLVLVAKKNRAAAARRS